MNKKILFRFKALSICALLTCFWFTHTLAQGNINVPQVILPSPAAANFIRYGEIPIDYSTGVPNVNIPLYTLKSRHLSLPISISYHASGNKVNDKSSIVGLGWVLNAGGIIAVTKLSNGSNPLPFSYQNAADFNNARQIASQGSLDNFRNFGKDIDDELKYKDLESDRYSYQLPNGESGVFRYDYLTGELVVLPHNPVKIEKMLFLRPEDSVQIIIGFKITAADGTIYTYKLPPNQISLDASVFNWDLVSIVSADQTDSIRFVYKSYGNKYLMQDWVCSVDMGDYGFSTVGSSNTYDTKYGYNKNIAFSGTSYERLLDSIVAPGIVIKFNMASDRQDRANNLSQNFYRLTDFTVSSPLLGKSVKTVSFDNAAYFGSNLNNYRLKLGGLSIKGSDQIKVENYKFVYEQGIEPPPYVETSGFGVFNEDYWGYNNSSGRPSLLPHQFIPVLTPGQGTHSEPRPDDALGDRDPLHNYAKFSMLEEIHYPTGGRTVFEFEPNFAIAAYDYAESGNPLSGAVGGFRIHKILNYSNNNVLSGYKTYEYGDGHTRTIQKSLFGYLHRVFETNGAPGGIRTYRTNVTSYPMLSLTADNGPPVFYQSVTEYNGDESGTVGKTTYEYETPPSETHAALNNAPDSGPEFMDKYELDRGNYVPHLKRRTDYKKANAIYVPVGSNLNTYTPYIQNQYSMGMHVTHKTTYGSDESVKWFDYKWCNLSLTACETESLGYPFYLVFLDLHATPEVSLLTQSKTYEYSAAGVETLAKTVDYIYNLTNLQPAQRTVSGSMSETWLTQYKYPGDYIGQNTAPYTSMFNNLHIWTPVIEELNYKNNTSNFLSSSRTNYAVWNGNDYQVYPSSVETRKGSEAYESRVTFNSYDNAGNIVSVNKTDGAATSYQWGYNKLYPVAEGTNAAAKNIFFEGFEENNGNSTDAHTGHYSFSGSYNKALTNLDNGSYTLSYWQKSAAGEWGLQKNTVAVTSGLATIAIPASGQIDDIRFYPVNGQLVTYTYDPLIGQTSVSDAQDMVTYYEYDSFGRLGVIKDAEKSIVKALTYNYAGQPAPFFNGVYYSAAQTKTVARNNCGDGYIGGTATSYIPEGKYTSVISQEDANLKAISELNIKVQDYANSIGTCTLKYGNESQLSAFLKSQSCAAGYQPKTYVYSVPANKYRATTQQGANQLALDDIAVNGQSQANLYGTCVLQGIYARISYENNVTIPASDGSDYNDYRDVVLRFYEDPEGYTPISVSNLSINISRSTYSYNTNQVTTANSVFTVSGSSKVIIPSALFHGQSGNDYIDNYWSIESGTGYLVTY